MPFWAQSAKSAATDTLCRSFLAGTVGKDPGHRVSLRIRLSGNVGYTSINQLIDLELVFVTEKAS